MCTYVSVSECEHLFLPPLRPDVIARQVLCAAVGATFCMLIFGLQSLHIFGSILITYIICAVVPRKHVGMVVLVLAYTHISACQIYRMITDYLGWSVDFTGPQMILVLKLTAFAWNYSDGGRLTKINTENRVGKRQAEYAVEKLPSFLMFSSYCLYFGSILTGPFFEYEDFRRFLFQENQGGPVPGKRVSSLVLKSFLFVGLFLLEGRFSMFSIVSTSEGYESFLSQPLIERIALTVVASVCFRGKYYFAWTFAEAGCLFSGFGYNGKDKDGVEKWDLLKNIDPFRIEVNDNLQEITTQRWNISVSKYLRHYSYERLRDSRKFGKLAKGLTFALSALWHGFYAGYFIFFLQYYFIESIHSNFRRAVTRLNPKVGYVLTSMLTFMTMSYAGISFILLDPVYGWYIYSALYFYGHIVYVGIFLVTLLINRISPPPSLRSGGLGSSSSIEDTALETKKQQ